MEVCYPFSSSDGHTTKWIASFPTVGPTMLDVIKKDMLLSH